MQSLLKIIKKSLFKWNLISFFINPSHFIRKWLYNWILENSIFLKWKILDFWCGSKPYQELFHYTEYLWIDIEQSWHDHTNENIDFYYDWKKIPFENNYFDWILSTEVFEHTFNLNDVLKELNRVLKKDWFILITIPFSLGEHEKPYDFWRYTSFWIKYLLENNWFKIEKIEKKWNYITSIFQSINFYVVDILFKWNFIIKWLLAILIIFPLNLIWTILGFILPKNDNLYLNLIILAKK